MRPAVALTPGETEKLEHRRRLMAHEDGELRESTRSAVFADARTVERLFEGAPLSVTPDPPPGGTRRGKSLLGVHPCLDRLPGNRVATLGEGRFRSPNVLGILHLFEKPQILDRDDRRALFGQLDALADADARKDIIG